MKNIFLFMLSILPLIILINVLIHSKSILIALLCLEILRLRIILIFAISNFSIEAYNVLCLIILLRVGACEARIGLCVLVSITRSTGCDHIMNLSLSKC